MPLQLSNGDADDFSFSTQWDEYFGQRVGRLWGWTMEERLEQFLMEMQVDRDPAAYELAAWFHKNGFASPILSHWDNSPGFGLVAVLPALLAATIILWRRRS